MQEVIVGLIVGAAALYAVWSFMPARWRKKLSHRMGWQGAARVGACHACDDCGSCSANSTAPEKKSG